MFGHPAFTEVSSRHLHLLRTDRTRAKPADSCSATAAVRLAGVTTATALAALDQGRARAEHGVAP
ncbi:hypothetical protein QTQ03_08850 [Micromonospora sp. WMMA1363]|uniref:hypothetical protein n=1 Tax=Micromonospora sp. WMMA1363 TaxID=3053985 RepID=UPI00259CD730|nr:hypothetical protein [Micromonospora sp. WMMA1363]MDM4719681.1 hypothetical protein [Micromonospora sp. WMMA1363]